MILIIFCSLTDSMTILDETQLPMPLDPALLLTLDIDGQNSDQISHIVKDHKHSWWTGCKPQDLDLVKVLDSTTFGDCLEHYERQCLADGPGDSSAMTMPLKLTHGNTSNTLDMLVNASGASQHEAGPCQLDARTGITWSGNPSNSLCKRCEQYHDVISNLLHDVLKFHTFSMAMSTMSGNQWQLGMRQASMFHQLHEAALLKETDASAATATVPPTGSLPAHTCASQYITNAAATNLTQLQWLPPSAYKWAWGTQLTAAEVLRSLLSPMYSAQSLIELHLDLGLY